ncbi:M16 family metallopeptidase [Maritimibacter dapengensis]|uniref:Insulinase family protein n=1 Tax=Maritimibacter dapengensis TaxID=2836868 RepID=A0ABS6SWL4_9RHOB|nr:pitrilysin family protein [Maritimibacter dapengensis]MBV7377334.1 insulinase family protein [Maritimibacter dapengensis]
MKRLISACVLACATAFPTWAQDVTDTVLDNGMEVVVIEDHRAPVVVHMVWYRAGGADEPLGTSGVAHFLEHLLFKATDDMESGEVHRVVAENGGSDNAFTSYDATAYFQRVAADRLELMMTMEADRMRDLILTEEDIETERDVILEERNMRIENSPGALLNEQMGAALFMNHPYGIPLIGWKHEMENLSREDALAFYRKYYAPNNAILVVAGDVEPDEVIALAEKHYGPLEPTEGLEQRARPMEPIPLAPRRITFEDARVGQPYVVRNYIAPARESGAQEEAAALVFLSEILGGSSATSVFGQSLEFDQKIAVSTWAGYSSQMLDLSQFSVGIVPAQGVSLEDAEAALDAEIEQFFEDGIDPDQFERIKTRIRASDIYAQDSARGLANRYGRALTTGLTVEDVEAWPDVLQAVTPEDVMAAAEKVFQPSHSVTGWLMAPDRETGDQPEAAPVPEAAPEPAAEPETEMEVAE